MSGNVEAHVLQIRTMVVSYPCKSYIFLNVTSNKRLTLHSQTLPLPV